MANCKFILGTIGKEGKAGIKLQFFYQGARFVYGTGLSINTKLWDSNTMRPIKDGKIIKEIGGNSQIKTELENISNRLQNIETLVKEFFSDKLLRKEEINLDDLRELLSKRFETKISKQLSVKPSEPSIPLIRDVIKQFIIDISDGHKTTRNGNEYNYRTLQQYLALLTFFDGFETWSKRKYTVLDISPTFRDNLVNYCNISGYKTNQTGKIIQQLKAVMNNFVFKAFDYDFNLNENQLIKIQMMLKRMDKPQEAVTSVVLTESELDKLYNFEFKKSYQNRARDLFLVACYTGLRYSDFSRLGREHIKKGFLQITNKKTGKFVEIPIRSELHSIMIKYDYKIPVISSQKLGDYAKEICEIAGIDELIEIRETRGGQTTITTKPKYEMISTHTGRRTALTQMINNGMSVADCMNISGHLTMSSFQKYIRPDNKLSERASKNPFFARRVKKLKVI